MVKIICSCGKEVVRGDIKTNDQDKRRFIMEDKPKGIILKNKSNNAKDWTCICSNCQNPKKETQHEKKDG